MKPIRVVEYDPHWPQVFESLKSKISIALREIVIAIEHVGSTSVPGLAAKPIIDMDVVVAESNVTCGIQKLSEIGYVHQGDLGIPQREAFRSPAGSHPHHLYLCPSKSPALANHLAIRDYLRKNPASAEAYGNLKRKLVGQHDQDIASYTQDKTAFLLAILRELGFSKGVLEDIEKMNRGR